MTRYFLKNDNCYTFFDYQTYTADHHGTPCISTAFAYPISGMEHYATSHSASQKVQQFFTATNRPHITICIREQKKDITYQLVTEPQIF